MNKTLINEILSKNINLVAVTKKHSKEEVDQLHELGLSTFGENRVQEFLTKYDPAYTWHIIGHLQTNKVKYIIGKVDMIESVDSLKLAKEIEKQAAKHDLVQKVLVELKVSQTDENKTGYPYENAFEFLKEMEQFEHIEVKGLMCIATNTDDQSINAKEFDIMKEIFDQARKQYPKMDTLSMGMSHDWRLALEHGSTQVRIGTALFEDE